MAATTAAAGSSGNSGTAPAAAASASGSDGNAAAASSNGSSSGGNGGGGGGSGVQAELSRLSARQLEQLNIYLDFMLETNKSMNLTAVRERGEAWRRHIEDSLALLPVIEAAAAKMAAAAGGTKAEASGAAAAAAAAAELSIVDVGSGAGLPGMVLAIARPRWRLLLADTLKKRCAFLEAAAARAGAANVAVHWERAEAMGQRKEFRERFDVAVARAVAAAPLLLELCVPLVRPGGALVAAKGPTPLEELQGARRAAAKLGCYGGSSGGGRKGRGSGSSSSSSRDGSGDSTTSISGGDSGGGGGGGDDAVVRLALVDSWSADGQRTALVVEKRGRTPKEYPRRPGVPEKAPL